MKTKRALIIIGSFLLAVLAGCGQGKQDLTEQQEKPEGSPIVVGFSQVGAESEWRVANTESIKRALSEERVTHIARCRESLRRDEIHPLGREVVGPSHELHFLQLALDLHGIRAEQHATLPALGGDLLSSAKLVVGHESVGALGNQVALELGNGLLPSRGVSGDALEAQGLFQRIHAFIHVLRETRAVGVVLQRRLALGFSEGHGRGRRVVLALVGFLIGEHAPVVSVEAGSHPVKMVLGTRRKFRADTVPDLREGIIPALHKANSIAVLLVAQLGYRLVTRLVQLHHGVHGVGLILLTAHACDHGGKNSARIHQPLASFN